MFKAALHWSPLFLAIALVAGCSSPNTAPTASSAPGDSGETGLIRIDGSSTVFPITNEVVEEYKFERTDEPTFEVTVSGTGGGFQKFCRNETDINDASRPISEAEIEACREAGVEFIEIPIAYDALTVVVHRDNTWADSMTLEELQTLWSPSAEGAITRWNQIRSDWPDQPIELYGPDVASGTFDYFTEVIVGEAGESRSDYTASEDDTELVRGVRTNPNGLGYFGYAYYEESQSALKSVAIDSGQGAVKPSGETVRSAAYQPLARPLFIYINRDLIDQKPELQSFIEYYLTNARYLVQVVGYEPLPDEAYAIAFDHFQNRRVGTVFDGKAQPGLTIEALLQKEAQF